jgi:flagellar basal-body rod protein FlgB
LAATGAIAGGIMTISDIPILSMLRTRLQWSQERQRVLAENVANADTPKYRGRDLTAPKFDEPTQVTPVPTISLATTASSHIGGMATTGSAFQTESKDKFEVRPTGNAVNLEDEMMKVAANQMDYQAVTALYTRSLNLMKTALGKR